MIMSWRRSEIWKITEVTNRKRMTNGLNFLRRTQGKFCLEQSLTKKKKQKTKEKEVFNCDNFIGITSG